MKNIALIILGSLILILTAICPFPSLLAVSGVVWRIIIGLLGCCLLTLGIYKAVKKR